MAQENYNLLALAAAAVTTDDGRVKWSAVITGAVTAAVIGLVADRITTAGVMARIEERSQQQAQRIRDLETGAAIATQDRYTSAQARNDIGRIQQELREMREAIAVLKKSK